MASVAELTRWLRQAARLDDDKPKRKICRPGKTRRDRSSGAYQRRYANQQARAEWQNDSKATIASFPWNACNGKRNRRLITGKCGYQNVIERQVTR